MDGPNSCIVPNIRHDLDLQNYAISLLSADWLLCALLCDCQEPWYKSGLIKDRVPSFCDRSLTHSLEAFADNLRPVSGTYLSANELFGGSDHRYV